MNEPADAQRKGSHRAPVAIILVAAIVLAAIILALVFFVPGDDNPLLGAFRDDPEPPLVIPTETSSPTPFPTSTRTPTSSDASTSRISRSSWYGRSGPEGNPQR